mmetsp:Transcript_21691/g.53727  ORF Transcript_21691/g.53727 Transcript_21691/m.53727 type:complete len:85 (+) Transcript_21691:51-305(+)
MTVVLRSTEEDVNEDTVSSIYLFIMLALSSIRCFSQGSDDEDNIQTVGTASSAPEKQQQQQNNNNDRQQQRQQTTTMTTTSVGI